MRIGNGNNGGAIVTSGDMKSADFNIRANGKAFRILSDSLYQNKQGSIVREICSNAMDSHIAAGTPDLPFEVHVPNTLEPYLSVKDFGVGLSHEQVFGVYTTLFASSKDNANDQVGAFGLGSKTPFSYTDTFTVTSIYDGMKRSYCAVIQGDTLEDGSDNPNAGIPTVMLMGEEETDAHNGVEVLMNVEEEDFSTFLNEIKTQLRFFRVKPIVKNIRDFEFEDVNADISFRLNNFNIMKDVGRHSHVSQRTYIVQGGVGYPLDYSKIRQYFNNNADMTEFVLGVEQRGAQLFFQIGEIEVTPSREGISYNNRTIENIANKFAAARQEFFTIAESEMDKLPNDWARGVALNEGGKLFRNAIKGSAKYGFEWYGSEYGYSIAKTTHDESIDPPQMLFHYRQLTKRGNTKLSENTATHGNIPCLTTVRIVFEDKCKNNRGRIRMDAMKHLDSYNGHGKRYIVLSPVAVLNTVTGEWDKEEITDAKLQEFADRMGGAPIIRLSTLPEPVRTYTSGDGVVTRRTGYKLPKLYAYTGGEFEKRSSYTQIYDKISEITGGTYVTIPEGERTVTVDFNESLYYDFKNAGVLDTGTIYAIRERDVAKIKDEPKWVSLKKFIEDKEEELKQPSPELFRIARQQAKMQACRESFTGLVDTVCEKTDVTALKRFRIRYQSAKSLTNRQQLIAKYAGAEYAALVTRFAEGYNKHRKNLFNRFPLLFTQYRGWNVSVEDDKIEAALLAYVKTV